MITSRTNPKETVSSSWADHLSSQLSTTQSVLRECLGWVVELGITAELQFFQKKNLALINGIAFSSLMLAMPGTFVLIVMGFSHPFSLLISIVTLSCLILSLNAARRLAWSKALFAFAPGAIITAYTLLELSSGSLGEPLNYLLARQGLCFALLVPVILYGFESRQKVTIIVGICTLCLLVFDVGSMRMDAFRQADISGLNHGLFSLLSLVQYMGLSACVLYVQNYALQHAQHTMQANEKLKRMAIRDGLTGMFNHGFMQQLIGDAINRSKRSATPLALLMIDVDAFKQINDTSGHNAGDEVLVSLTRLLKENKRATDYLGRWGGDELVLLLTDTDLAGAANLAEKLRCLVECQVFPHGKKLTLSVGASEYKDGDSPANFMARADAAMYRAKRAGRNRVEV